MAKKPNPFAKKAFDKFEKSKGDKKEDAKGFKVFKKKAKK